MFYLTTLKNGLRVITAPMREANSIGISILVGAGSRYETPEINGISHFLEHIFLIGTRKRPTQRDLTTAIEGIGGIINGWTNRESTSYWIKIPKEHFEEGLDVVLDMVLHSRLGENSLERERGVVIQEINKRHDSPENYVWQLSCLGGSEKRKVLTSEEIIKAIDKVKSEDIQRVAQELFVDKCLNLAVIGPVKDKGEIKELLTF